MKTNFQQMHQRWSLIYSGLLIFAIIFDSQNLFAQNLTKTFVKEIEVSQDAEIFTNTPQQFDKHMHATMSTNFTAKAYTVNGKNGDLVLYVDRNYEIETWDKNLVRQEVEITIVPENRDEAQQLMKNLKIDLFESPADEVNVNAAMNIKRFELRNGFLKDDKSTIQLRNGEKYAIKTLYIKAKLTVPKTNPLSVEGRYCLLKVGDLEADLDLDIYHSEINIGHTKGVRANLNSCFNAFFKTIEYAQISAKNSAINIDKIKHLNVGFVELMEDCEFENHTNSSISHYDIKEVETLNIAETKNDKFTLGKVGQLSSPSSVFSNYEIKELTGSVKLAARSGDLTIREVMNSFGHISVNNEISTVILKMAEDCNYLVNVFAEPTSEYFLPTDLEKIKEVKDMKTTYLKGNKEKASEIDIQCEKCKVVFQN